MTLGPGRERFSTKRSFEEAENFVEGGLLKDWAIAAAWGSSPWIESRRAHQGRAPSSIHASIVLRSSSLSAGAPQGIA
jgi:hypothetical protein